MMRASDCTIVKTVVPNSQLHFGGFLHGRLEGVMQFGPSINKRGTVRSC
jgi:hypothetical protein